MEKFLHKNQKYIYYLETLWLDAPSVDVQLDVACDGIVVCVCIAFHRRLSLTHLVPSSEYFMQIRFIYALCIAFDAVATHRLPNARRVTTRQLSEQMNGCARGINRRVTWNGIDKTINVFDAKVFPYYDWMRIMSQWIMQVCVCSYV